MSLPAKEKRVRRRPEDAKALILDAAEAGMTADGPAGLRLADVARAAGVSHPTILHHFGSREGLVRALNLRSLEALKISLVAGMAGAQSGEDGVRRSFAAYRDGIAQRLLWLMQSGAEPPPGSLTLFDEIVTALHALRVQLSEPGIVPDIEDTRAVVHLSTIAAFGDAVIGKRLRQSSDDAERAARERFEGWFSDLLNLYMVRSAGRS